MAMNQFGAGFILTAKDHASSVFRDVQGAYGRFTASAKKNQFDLQAGMAKSALGVATLSIGRKMTSAIWEVAEAGKNYEQLLTKAAAHSGMTQKQMAEAHTAIMDTRKDPEQAAAALYEYQRQAVGVEDSLKGLMPALLLSDITGQGAAQTAGLLADTMDTFKLKASDLGPVTNKMAVAIKGFGLEAEKVPQLLNSIATGAQMSGIGFDDAMQAVAMVGSVLPDAGKAAASVNMSLMQLSSDKVKKGLRGLGISVSDSAGKFRPLLEIIGDVSAKTAKMTDVQKRQTLMGLFGGRAAGGMAIMFDALDKGVRDANGNLLKGADAAKYMADQFKNSQGAAYNLAAAYKGNFAGALERLSIAWKRLWISFSPSVLKGVSAIIDAIASVINTIADAVDALPPQVKDTILSIVGGLGSLVTMVGGFLALQGVMSMLGISFSGLIIAVAKFILIAAPLTFLLGGLAIGFYALYRSASKSSAAFGFTLEDLQTKAKLAFQAITELFTSGKLSKGMEDELAKAENSGLLRFVRAVEGFMERIKAVWAGVKRGFEIGIDALAYSPAFARLRQTFGGFIELLTGGTSEEGKQSLEEWGKKGEEIGLKLASFGESAADVTAAIIDFAKTVANFIKNFNTQDMVDMVMGMVSAWRDFWNVLWYVGETVRGLYRALKLIVSVIAEVIGGLANFVGWMAGVEGARGGGWFDAENWTWTVDAFKDLQNMGDRSMEHARVRAEEEAARPTSEKKAREVAALTEQAQIFKAYAETGVLPEGMVPAGGVATPFAQRNQADRDAMIVGLDRINDRLKELHAQPVVVNLDGTKLGEGVRKSPAFTGDNSLDPAAEAGF